MSPRARRRRERVEVRETAGGRELRIDGTFASSLREGSVVTGSVWDAIAAPVLLLPEERVRSVLLLGLGGGSVARIVRALCPKARIVGVEFDPEVVEVARRSFGPDELGVEVRVADALDVLREAGPQHDVVIDDVFVGSGRNVHKPGWLPSPGHELAMQQLAPGGLLISNALDEAPAVARNMRQAFAGVLQIEVEDYDNRVLVGGPASLRAALLRRRLAENGLLRETLPLLRVRTLAGGRGSAGADSG
jgi:spermidine synthase